MTADLPDGYTATLGTPSGDAEDVEVPGWCNNAASNPPIHRWAESCGVVGCAGLWLRLG